jgi:hypothetical protein
MGDRPDLGSIAFGLAGDGCEGCEVARVLVSEPDLGSRDPVGLLHPNVEVLAVTARSEQRKGSATAPFDDAHFTDFIQARPSFRRSVVTY